MVDLLPTRSRRPLQVPRLPLVGRDDDLARLAELAARPSTRLITICGIGGIGKTRLAFELAARRTDERTPVVVELAPISDPASIVPAIADALDLSTAGEDAEREVATALSRRPTLLVLDNLEHLVVRHATTSTGEPGDMGGAEVAGIAGVAGIVRSLLVDVPGLQIVATSRVALGITGEHVWRTRPLAVPGESDPTASNGVGGVTGVAGVGPGGDVGDVGAGSAAGSPAGSPNGDRDGSVRMFCSVAEAVDGRFVLDDATRADVIAICRRLGGHPLAIELAAARLAHLGPAALRRELERRSATMFGSPRTDAPERHRDLHATISWSYDQLGDGARSLFRRLAVFESWTTLAVIESFLTPDDLAEAEAARAIDPLDTLAALADQHLLETVHDRLDTRYRLLPPIRDVAMSLLAQDDDEHRAAVAAHDRAFHQLAREAVAGHDEPGGHLRVPELHTARDDMVAALERAIQDGRATAAADLAAALGWLASLQRVFDVHRQRLDRAAEMPGAAHAEPASRMLLHGWRLVLHARSGAGGARLTELDRHRPAAADPAGPADGAGAATTEVLRAAHVTMLLQLVRAFVLARDLDGAQRVGTEVLELVSGSDDRWRARAEAVVGMVANVRGDTDVARRLGLASLERARRVGDRKTIVRAGLLLTAVPDGLGESTITLQEMHDLARLLDDPETLDWVLPVMAVDALQAGEMGRAARSCADALGAPRWGRVDMGLMCAVVLAVMTAGQRPALAARIHGMLSDRRHTLMSHTLPAQRAMYDASIDHVRLRLGTAAFDAAVADGARVEWHDARRELECVAEAMAGSTTLVTGSSPEAMAARARGPMETDVLTPRELQVLRHLAVGLTNREIGKRLSLSVKTVMHHTTAIYRKLDVRGRTEAAAVAHRCGVLDDGLPG